MIYTVVLSIHVILAAFLVGLVLLQQGKGADVGAIMGGGANSLFGVSGASNLLVKMTTGVAIAFMVTSVLLIRISAAGGRDASGEYDPLTGSALAGAVVAATAASPVSVTPALSATVQAAAEVVPVAPVVVATAAGIPSSESSQKK